MARGHLPNWAILGPSLFLVFMPFLTIVICCFWAFWSIINIRSCCRQNKNQMEMLNQYFDFIVGFLSLQCPSSSNFPVLEDRIWEMDRFFFIVIFKLFLPNYLLNR